MIQFHNVHNLFGAKTVLDGFSLSIPDRETTVVIGYSGSGKSVALKHIVGPSCPIPAKSKWTARRWASLARMN
jgi:ABC-type transporter Mla maintaining outer membrane lipid asymmetry ATPase subunit MlaF